MPTNASSPPSPLGNLIHDLSAQVRGLVSGLVPEDVPLSWAPGVLEAFAELERIAASGRLLITARAVEAGRWKSDGAVSPADWLAAKAKSSVGRARADLGTSERLGELPLTSESVRAGTLSTEQAEIVSDAAVVNPDAESELLDLARRESVKHTREQAARRKAEAESELSKREREERVRRRRAVRCWSKDGEWFLRANGPIVEGQRIEQAINEKLNELFRSRRKEKGTVKDQPWEGRDAYGFDALTDLVTNGRAGRRRASVRELMLIRVDLQALIRGQVGPGEVCEIGGLPISVEEARGLVGECITSLIVTNGEAVIDVVNLSRKPTVAQEIALLWTSPKCVVEGCNRTVTIEVDHDVEWRESHHTVLGELLRKCKVHHFNKTHDGWALVEGTGRRPMVPPDHPLHPDRRARGEPLRDTG